MIESPLNLCLKNITHSKKSVLSWTKILQPSPRRSDPALLLYGPVAGTYNTTTVSCGSPVPKNIFVTPVILPANLNYAEIVPCATPFAMNLSLTPARNTPSRLMFVTAVANAIPVVWKNICTSLKMPTPGTVHFFQNPAPAFPFQKKKSNT